MGVITKAISEKNKHQASKSHENRRARAPPPRVRAPLARNAVSRQTKQTASRGAGAAGIGRKSEMAKTKGGIVKSAKMAKNEGAKMTT
jgi:hypothetical protein